MRFSTANLLNISSWFRVGFSLGFFYVLYYSWSFIVFLAFLQSVCLLLLGYPSQILGYYVHSVYLFVQQLLAFVLFVSDERPYPFNLIPDDIQYYKKLFSQ